MQKALIILNASSGRDDKKDAVEVVEKIFLDRGWDCVITRIEPGIDIRAVAADAVEEGIDRVVAGGGDGTLRAAAAALTGTNVPLGVLPVGTLNHFARDLEIPLELEAAAGIAAGDGVPVDVDVGQVNGYVFINNSVMGLYPEYRKERDSNERRGWGKFLSMSMGVASTIWRYPYLHIRFDVDGKEMYRRSPYIMIANNAHAMEGFKPWERDKLTAGHLWVYIMRDRSRRALVRIIAKILTGGTLAHEEFDTFQAPEVRIETRQRRVGISLDGEVLRLNSPVYFRCCPKYLRVIVPRNSKRVQEVDQYEGGHQFVS